MKLQFKPKIILFAILILGAGFRFYNLNWDQGYHLHPDERAIIMNVVQLQFPQSLDSFFSTDSPWNTHFFAYGSFPFYLLKITGNVLGIFEPLFTGYDLINIAGRFTSAMFDLATLVLVFYIGKKLAGMTAGFISAFLYAVSVLPIQLSHFFAVDTILTFFCLAVIYRLILYYEKPGRKNALLIGIFFGLALSTKVSAIVLFVPIGLVFLVNFLSNYFKKPRKKIDFWKKNFIDAGLILVITFLTFAICSPYALIDFPEFWRQTLEQSAMTKNAFVFPYTLQYVGKIPYWYEIKNIFLWGLGPITAVITFGGAFNILYEMLTRKKQGKWVFEAILVVYFLAYFWVVGKFAIGFMRYMLPLYPLLCIFGGITGFKFLKYLNIKIKNSTLLYTFYFILYVIILIWPLSFIHIYTVPNTRTTATQWMNTYLPAGKTLAIEHWDDPLPMGAHNFNIVTLPLYDPDTDEKWQNINNLLAKTDYIIIASNRLYTPLQKLTYCKTLPQDRCYTKTAEYYKKLFNGSMDFQKIAEFRDYPMIPFFNIYINDQEADESFTVYDHPKLMIFQRIRNFNYESF